GAQRDDLHLSKDAWGLKVQDTIKKSFAQYKYHHPAPVLAGTAKVKHVLTGRTVDAGTLVNQNGQADLGFDLAGLPLGQCQLLINNLLTEQFYYCGSAVLPSLFGVVELKLDSSLKANYRMVQADRSLSSPKP